MLRIEPTFQIFQMIDECLFDYTRKPRQLYFLDHVLRSHGSTFNQFTYSENRMAGNISDKEDVLDRIISFL